MAPGKGSFMALARHLGSFLFAYIYHGVLGGAASCSFLPFLTLFTYLGEHGTLLQLQFSIMM